MREKQTAGRQQSWELILKQPLGKVEFLWLGYSDLIRDFVAAAEAEAMK